MLWLCAVFERRDRPNDDGRLGEAPVVARVRPSVLSTVEVAHNLNGEHKHEPVGCRRDKVRGRLEPTELGRRVSC